MNETANEIRQKFLDYFSSNGHLIIPNSSLVPINDPTLLLVNSGMAPLKPYFTKEKQPPIPRLCNIQKCVRTNDIESVGNNRHLTFFEMMGNWSIGDYFKDEAIHFAWVLVGEVFGFDTSQIYVTVYGGDERLPNVPPDEETQRIWETLLPSERVVRLGIDSNFWGPAGETGPCGPCTEIFIDRGVKYGCERADCNPECGCGRFLEIWNAGVFMQYYLDEKGNLGELPLKSVDAGAGVERFAMILQDVDSVYETDLLKPIAISLTEETNLDHRSRSIRIITDHLRCGVFMIADGIYPANTKREYVLRRILRRAFLHAHLAGINPNRFPASVKTIVELFSSFYPELAGNREKIEAVITQEENNFHRILNRGLRELEKIFSRSREKISGSDAFKLHDTLGFPFDLTKEIAQARGFSVDEDGFKKLFKEQQGHSQKAKN